MRFFSIASGSSGNCIYTGTDTTHLIVDAGISGKKIEAGLNTAGVTSKDLNGILVTHEHRDHICGLGVMARRYGIPMYATADTIDFIIDNEPAGKIDRSLFNVVKADEEFEVGDITVTPISISHDAVDPVAYKMKSAGKSVGVITDLGVYDDYIISRLKGMDILLIEANHDVRMLETGRYPYPLKQRILGKKGHLSNESSGQLLTRLLHDKLKTVILGHLSKENNYERLAYETVRLEISMGETPYKEDDFPIYVAGRDCPSQVFTA